MLPKEYAGFPVTDPLEPPQEAKTTKFVKISTARSETYMRKSSRVKVEFIFSESRGENKHILAQLPRRHEMLAGV